MYQYAILVFLCLATPVSAVLLPPSNLRLESKNFQHILTWEDPNNESVVYYKVGYNEDSTAKVSKSCSNITSRRCDLTKDFTDVMSEYNVWVHSFTDLKVSNNTTIMFRPILHTVLGPALVNVVPGNHSIEVFIDPPISHLWDETEQRDVTMERDDVYPLLIYTIHYGRSGESPQAITLESTRNSTVIPQLLPNTNYCVSVDVKAAQNLPTPIPSAQKCVITGPHTVLQGSKLDVIIPVLCGTFLFLGILLTLLGLDRAGYIGKRRSFIPKVLKSFSRSESRYSGSDPCPSPTCVVPVEIVSQKLDTEDQYQEGGYASRKRLLDSDTSAGDSSGPVLSTNSLSLESSGLMSGSSDEEIISSNQIGLDIITDSGGSFSPIPANALESSSDLPLNNSGVFNINLNSICTGSPADTSTGLKIGGSSKEEPTEKPVMNPGQAELSPNRDIMCMSNFLVDFNTTGTDDGSDNYEEDVSDNADSDCVGSGYMRR